MEYLLDRGTRFRILEGGERKTIENKWVTAERAWKDVEIVEKYMILRHLVMMNLKVIQQIFWRWQKNG